MGEREQQAGGTFRRPRGLEVWPCRVDGTWEWRVLTVPPSPRRVRFTGEIVIDVDPEEGEVTAQDVQDEIGYAGVVVVEIEQPNDREARHD